jgi:hypothetical protein
MTCISPPLCGWQAMLLRVTEEEVWMIKLDLSAAKLQRLHAIYEASTLIGGDRLMSIRQGACHEAGHIVAALWAARLSAPRPTCMARAGRIGSREWGRCVTTRRNAAIWPAASRWRPRWRLSRCWAKRLLMRTPARLIAPRSSTPFTTSKSVTRCRPARITQARPRT